MDWLVTPKLEVFQVLSLYQAFILLVLSVLINQAALLKDLLLLLLVTQVQAQVLAQVQVQVRVQAQVQALAQEPLILLKFHP